MWPRSVLFGGGPMARIERCCGGPRPGDKVGTRSPWRRSLKVDGWPPADNTSSRPVSIVTTRFFSSREQAAKTTPARKAPCIITGLEAPPQCQIETKTYSPPRPSDLTRKRFPPVRPQALPPWHFLLPHFLVVVSSGSG